METYFFLFLGFVFGGLILSALLCWIFDLEHRDSKVLNRLGGVTITVLALLIIILLGQRINRNDYLGVTLSSNELVIYLAIDRKKYIDYVSDDSGIKTILETSPAIMTESRVIHTITSVRPEYFCNFLDKVQNINPSHKEFRLTAIFPDEDSTIVTEGYLKNIPFIIQRSTQLISVYKEN